MSVEVGIIGGGISGLLVGYYLTVNGCDVSIYEAEDRVGGKIRTLRQDGYIFDTGANSGLESTPLLPELCESVGILDDVRYASDLSRNRYIYKEGKLIKLPMTITDFVRTDLFSKGAKLRLLCDLAIGRGVAEESVAEFVKRRIGNEFLDYAINPFVAGVYAGSPERLSVKYAFPKLYKLEERYRSLLLGTILGARERRKRAEKSKIAAQIFSFKNGMSQLPEVLSEILKDKIWLNSKITRIIREDNKYYLFAEVKGRLDKAFDKIVIAVPAYEAANLVMRYDEGLSELMKKVEYPPVAVVNMVFREQDMGFKERGFGFLVPEKEKRRILGTLFNSYMFEGRVPEGQVLLTSFVGGSRQPELVCMEDTELIDIVLKELRDILSIKGAPLITLVKKWSKAIPQYNLGYGELLSAINNFEDRHEGIFFCANYKGGIALADCVMSAHSLANRLLLQVHCRGI